MACEELNRLRQGLLDGAFTPGDLERRVSTLIEDAYQRSPVDVAYISACEALLRTVATGRAQTPSSVVQPCREAIRRHSRIAKGTGLGWRGRFVLAAAVLAAILCLGEFLDGRQWVGGESLWGGGTYLISQHTLETGLPDAAADADRHESAEPTEFRTQSVQALTEHLGFTPPMIDAQVLGLTRFCLYQVFHSESSVQIIMLYGGADSGQGSPSMTVSLTDYASEEDVFCAFSQSGPGRYVRIAGQTVYLAEHAGSRSNRVDASQSATWVDGLRVARVITNAGEEALLTAVEMLLMQE